jgi:hypothetical protein
MRVDRREFLMSTAPLGYALTNPELTTRYSPIDLTYAEPAPKELMERYLQIFSLIKKRNEGSERFLGATGNSVLDAFLDGIPVRDAIVNLNVRGKAYYAAKLNEDLYFGNGFQFSVRESGDNGKYSWILTPDFAINRFGRLDHNFFNNSLPYMDLLRKLHIPDSNFPDLYAKSKTFETEFTSFVKALERYA